ncbi:MAG: membrane protein insertion efficiency factor YidD [Kofleriaceae bacterium]
MHRLLVAIVLLPVMVYRRVLSPMKRVPTCRYLPTCSEYAVEAVKTRGIVVGIGLSVWRVLRCQPFARGGHDPVPPPRCRAHPHAQEQH